MSTLSDIKKIRKLYPDDVEFAKAINVYLDANKTCCDEDSNLIDFEDRGNNPYGYYVIGKKCKVCGTIVETKFI